MSLQHRFREVHAFMIEAVKNMISYESECYWILELPNVEVIVSTSSAQGLYHCWSHYESGVTQGAKLVQMIRDDVVDVMRELYPQAFDPRPGI